MDLGGRQKSWFDTFTTYAHPFIRYLVVDVSRNVATANFQMLSAHPGKYLVECVNKMGYYIHQNDG